MGLLWIAALLVAARFCHSGVLWVEEAYPLAGAIELLHGRVPYRDFWYDKPPLTPLFYLLCGGHMGWALRALGVVFTGACVAGAFQFARDLWGRREGEWAALLMAVVLTLGFPATVMAIAPDLFLVLVQIWAVWLAYRGKGFGAGVVSGLGVLAHLKAAFIVLVCLALARSWRFVAGLALPFVAAAAALFELGAWDGFVEQVWHWGRVYAADGLRPWTDGVARTLATFGYWSALMTAALWFWWRERQHAWWAWVALMLLSAWMGARFFPRYYFALAPPLVLMAARGMTLARGWPALLLAIPLIRFGPGVVNPPAADLALFEDAQAAVALLPARRESVFVWGYRPEISVLARASSGTPFLESQPLTGVFADRHLASSARAADGSAARRRLTTTSPDFIVDGLGLMNPALAISAYEDLRPWLAGYEEIGRTKTCVIYRSNKPAASRGTP